MTSIDLSPILTPVLQVVGIALAAFAAWALKNLAQKLGIQANSAALANIDAAAAQAIQTGVMASQDVIKAKNWDHVDTQNAIIASAATALVETGSKALSDFGIDPSTPAGAAAVTELVTRALPAGVAVAAASPTTPPVPDDQKPTVQSLLVPVAAVKGAL